VNPRILLRIAYPAIIGGTVGLVLKCLAWADDALDCWGDGE
jgi:hypothetical protein